MVVINFYICGQLKADSGGSQKSVVNHLSFIIFIQIRALADLAIQPLLP